MKVIVNADDFGHGEARTLAICEAFARGLLTTTTVMANMPWFERAVAFSRERGFFDRVGLHFNLTEGVPLTSRMREDEFFCTEGLFNANFHRSLRSRLYLPKILGELVRGEAKAQVERYCDAGFPLKHLDSHHHVHTDFSVARELYPIAMSAGFRTSRMSRTIAPKMRFDKIVYKILFNTWANKRLPFLVRDFTDFWDFMRVHRTLPDNASIEVMVHPGLEEDVPLDVMSEFWKKNQTENFTVYQMGAR